HAAVCINLQRSRARSPRGRPPLRTLGTLSSYRIAAEEQQGTDDQGDQLACKPACLAKRTLRCLRRVLLLSSWNLKSKMIHAEPARRARCAVCLAAREMGHKGKPPSAEVLR